MLQREIHAADPVGFLLQMIERPHQKHMIEGPESQRLQFQTVGGVGDEGQALLLRLLPGQPDIAGRQVHQSDGTAPARVMEGIPPRPAADVEDGIARLDIAVHHPGGQVEFKWMGLEPFPFPLRRLIIIPFHRFHRLSAHMFPVLSHSTSVVG